MYKNTKQMFLLFTLVFLLIGLSTLNATELSENDTMDSTTHIKGEALTKNPTSEKEPVIKSDENKDNTKKFNKSTDKNAIKQDEEKIDTTLQVNFKEEPADENYNPPYKSTNIDRQYTLKINLTEDQGNTGIGGTVNLYLLNEEEATQVQIDQTGYLERTYTVNKLGEMLTIYATYEGDGNYNPTTSDEIHLDSQPYTPTITLNTIEDTQINGTIIIQGKLYYDRNKTIANANITISINNRQIATTQTDAQGNYYREYVLENYETARMQTLSVKYHSSNEKLTDAYNQSLFDIEKISNNITINAIEDAVVSNTITISGNVIDQNNRNYEGIMNITITDKNTNEIYYTNSQVPVNNGQYNMEVRLNRSAIYRIELTIDEDSHYTESYRTQEFTAEKAILILRCENMYESVVGENVSISANITNEYENPVKDVLIEISTENTVLGQATTDEEGKFTFTEYIFNEIPDEDFFQIYFTIPETNNYENLYEETSYILSKRGVNIEITTEELIKINQTLHINGHINDIYNETIIPEGTITIIINSEEQAQIPIEENGTFTTAVDIHEKYVGTELLIMEAQYNPQNQKQYYTDDSITKEIIHDKLETALQIVANDTQVEKETEITVTLRDENNQPLNETITLKITNPNNTTVYMENIQLENGQKQIGFTPQTEGIYNIQAQYTGKENIYVNSIIQKEIHAEKNPTEITINNKEESHVNETIEIKGKLTDIDENPIKDADIIITINSTTEAVTINTKTNETGEYNITYRPQHMGDVQIRAEYTGNNTYHENHTETTIKVKKHQTTITIEEIPTTKLERNITITGNVCDEENMAANGSVTIKMNEETLTTINLENGKYTYNHTITTPNSNHNITVIFNENEAYNTSTAKTSFQTEALNTQIIIDKIDNITVLNQVTIRGKLVDENNKNINGQVHVEINGTQINPALTVTEGNFEITYTPQTAGTYSIKITYTGDNSHYHTTTANDTFNATKDNLKIENIQTTTNHREIILEVTGQINSETNLNTANVPIEITIGENTYQNITTENGTFTINTDKLLPGQYTITIKTIETTIFDPAETQTEPVTINKQDPVINMEDIQNTYSEEIIITGNITDTYQRPLNNTNITITVNNRTYNTTTDNQGKYSIPSDNFNAGENIIKITVEETPTTSSNTREETITLNKAETQLTLETNNDIAPGETLHITGKLTTIENEKLANKTVTIKVNTKKYEVTTDENGTYNLNITDLRATTYKIQATFTDNNYNTRTNTTQIKVEKLQVTLEVDDVVVRVGETFTLTATLKDQYQNPVTGGNLVFKVNGRTLRTDGRFDTNTTEVYKFTVNNGRVEYTLTAEQYLRKGINITASYSGSYRYHSAKSYTATLGVQLRYANVNVTATPQTVKQHENITFTATITDTTPSSERNLVNENGSSVIFKINGITIKDSNNEIVKVPVKNNTAILNYTVGVMAAVDINNYTRDYNLTAVYYSPYYYPVNHKNSTVFNTERSTVNIDIISATVKNDKLNVKAKMTDYKNHALEGENKICIKINGVTYKENSINKYYTITNGEIDISDIDVTGMNINTIEIVTGQRQAYEGARNSTTNIVYE